MNTPTPDDDLLQRSRLIAIVRGVAPELIDETAHALVLGGVNLLEVTMNTAGALATIARWRTLFSPQVCIGAGTVLSLEEARSARSAGAEFIVAPNVNPSVIAYAREHGLAVYPGALTPSEILQAAQAGASAVKVFPVSALGGERYIRELRGPLGHVLLIAVGGVTLDNALNLLEAGAVAVGVGGALTDPQLIAKRDFAGLTERARAFVAVTRRPATLQGRE